LIDRLEMHSHRKGNVTHSGLVEEVVRGDLVPFSLEERHPIEYFIVVSLRSLQCDRVFFRVSHGEENRRTLVHDDAVGDNVCPLGAHLHESLLEDLDNPGCLEDTLALVQSVEHLTDHI
ncbi:hypothetical protein PMAYCL1PPCAC_30269, partial [Pristionchus mayeri]